MPSVSVRNSMPGTQTVMTARRNRILRKRKKSVLRQLFSTPLVRKRETDEQVKDRFFNRLKMNSGSNTPVITDWGRQYFSPNWKNTKTGKAVVQIKIELGLMKKEKKMPAKMHRALKRAARRKGLTGKRAAAYIYGTMAKHKKGR